MSLLAFYLLYYTFACLLRHFHGFNLSLSRVEPFHLSFVPQFQGHVGCRNFTLTRHPIYLK